MLILSTSRTFCPECHDPYCVGRCTNPRKISNSYCAMTFPELSNLCVIYQGHGLSRLPGAGCLVWIDMLAETSARKLIPALPPRPYPHLTSSPRGSHPEVCRWRGGGGACGWGYDPLPGGFGAPPWGYYGPCARSSLERSVASRLRPMPDEMRQGDEPNWR